MRREPDPQTQGSVQGREQLLRELFDSSSSSFSLLNLEEEEEKYPEDEPRDGKEERKERKEQGESKRSLGSKKKKSSGCDVCEISLKTKDASVIRCDACDAPLRIHGWHKNKNQRIVCEAPKSHRIDDSEGGDGGIASELGSTAIGIKKMRGTMRILAACHGCLGKSSIERKYGRWLESTKKARSEIESQLSQNKKDEKALRERKRLNEQAEEFGRSAAHCIISNQMLEWYSPMIVVSFYDIHDVEGCGGELNPDFEELLPIVTEKIMAFFKTGTPQEEAISFDKVMTALCTMLHKAMSRSKPGRMLGLLGAMRYAIATALRVKPRLLLAVTQMKSLALQTGYRASDRLWALRHLSGATTVLSPSICQTVPPEKGGDPLKSQISDVKSLGSAICSLVGQCRTSVFEVGKQCRDCEKVQGDDPFLYRYFHELPLGETLALVLHNTYEDNPWLLTVDFLKAGIDHFASKFGAAYTLARKGQNKHLLPFLEVMRDNWLLFCLYYATCMLEGSFGFSPFRADTEKLKNPFIVHRKK